MAVTCAITVPSQTSTVAIVKVGEELIVTVKLTVLSQPIELVSVKEIVYTPAFTPLQFTEVVKVLVELKTTDAELEDHKNVLGF